MSALLVLAAGVGYLAGSVSTATIVASRRGVDLRAVGSGNPGATNVGRALGRRAGVVVALLDVAKGLLPAAVLGAADHQAGLVAGVAAVLGHVTSPFLRGRGGRGVATAAGAVLGSHPLWAVVVLAVWVVVVAASRWVALASISAALAVLVVAVVAGEDVVWAACLAAVVLVRHQPNVARRLERRRPPPLGADG
ncbi:MAG TPA: glycerol-3-phosphate 1-O-acyltransferase PlsY [Mycobacteriales bacterium]|nr:glycerol-3-phosphate 1-O-acyltransferase PlsY [Mycobacteriales bacterium]